MVDTVLIHTCSMTNRVFSFRNSTSIHPLSWVDSTKPSIGWFCLETNLSRNQKTTRTRRSRESGQAWGRMTTAIYAGIFHSVQYALLVGGWTNPFEKYQSKWVHLPQVGVKIKNIWNHHLDYHCINFCVIFDFLFNFSFDYINPKGNPLSNQNSQNDFCSLPIFCAQPTDINFLLSPLVPGLSLMIEWT